MHTKTKTNTEPPQTMGGILCINQEKKPERNLDFTSKWFKVSAHNTYH